MECTRTWVARGGGMSAVRVETSNIISRATAIWLHHQCYWMPPCSSVLSRMPRETINFSHLERNSNATSHRSLCLSPCLAFHICDWHTNIWFTVRTYCYCTLYKLRPSRINGIVWVRPFIFTHQEIEMLKNSVRMAKARRQNEAEMAKKKPNREAMMHLVRLWSWEWMRHTNISDPERRRVLCSIYSMCRARVHRRDTENKDDSTVANEAKLRLLLLLCAECIRAMAGEWPHTLAKMQLRI